MQNSRFFLLIELEISTSVVVRDVLNHLSKQFTVVWQQALLHVVSKHVTEDAAEIFMTRIAHKRTTVGQHTNKAAQQTQYGQGVHLALHAVLLVVEPPARAKLYLARLTTLEVAEHGSNHFVGTGVQRIQNGTRELILRVQLIKEFGHSLGGIELTNRVETSIST